MRDWLKSRNYCFEIRDELAKDYATNLQRAFEKGKQMAGKDAEMLRVAEEALHLAHRLGAMSVLSHDKVREVSIAAGEALERIRKAKE
jgi:hypothetical protein